MFNFTSRLFTVIISFLVFTNCKLTHTELIYPEKSEISIKNIPKSIVYYAPSHPEAPISNGVFTAKGLGGMGLALDDVMNTLTPFTGLELQTNTWIEPSAIEVILTASGNEKCQSYFVYDTKDLKIKLQNTHFIDTLMECQLDVSVKVTNPENKVTEFHELIPFVFNLTLNEYGERNDPLVKALMSQINVTDINKLATWLRNDLNSLDIKISDSRYASKVHHVNALTSLMYLNTLDLSETSLESTYALSFLNELRVLNLSNTQLTEDELIKLASSSHLSTLTLQNLNLESLKFLESEFLKLDALDLSKNKKLFNHLSKEDIEHLKKMERLKDFNIAETNLRNFSQLYDLKNLMETVRRFNVSDNDLLLLSSSDENFLKNLKHLEFLDVSYSNMSVAFLNSYFYSLKMIDDSKLKHFIYRGRYSKKQPIADSHCSVQNGSFIINIANLKLLPTLESIDFHGQGCIDDNQTEFGLTDTFVFAEVENLTDLNISSTPVKSFEGLKDLKKLKKLIVSDQDGGISMSAEACVLTQSHFIPNTEIDSCAALNTYNLNYKMYTEPDVSHEFVVPDNVWMLTISGCSGGNGGAGGGASGSMGAWSGPESASVAIYVSNGGDSGAVNGNPDLKTRGGRAVPVTKYNKYFWYQVPAYPIQHGGDGGVGLQSSIQTENGAVLIDFPLARETTTPENQQFCSGGSNGLSGPAYTINTNVMPQSDPLWNHYFTGQAGGPNMITPWSSLKRENIKIAVVPGQKLYIKVGSGGAGGTAGRSSYITSREGVLLDGKTQHIAFLTAYNHKYLGNSGQPGTNGANGFISIGWENLKP